MTLTDGKTTVEISKEDVETILNELHELRRNKESWDGEASPDSPLEVLVYKLESLDF